MYPTLVGIVVVVLACLQQPVTSTVLMTLQTTCQPLLVNICHNYANATVCYDNHVYPDWCSFLKAGCAGTVRPNISTTTVNVACNVSIVIRQHTTSMPATPQPLTAFEDHLFHAAIHGIDDLLLKANTSGATIDEMKKIFSVQDHAHRKYVRSNTCWAHSLDMTSISPWNSNKNTRKAGVLVSPRHALWARHYSMPVNTTLRFVDKNNTVVDRHIVKTHALPLPPSTHSFLHGYDIVVGELDSDVPDTISFVKVFPRNLTTIRPRINMRVPVVDTDFEEKALVADLSYESGSMVSLSVPLKHLRHELYERKISGDSGNPVFMVLDNQLVLMFAITYGGAGSGTSVTYHYDDINTILKNWGTGYSLTEINLNQYLDGTVSIPEIIG